MSYNFPLSSYISFLSYLYSPLILKKLQFLCLGGRGGGRSTEKKRNWKKKKKKGKLQFFSNKIQTRVLINREKLCLLAVWKEL